MTSIEEVEDEVLENEIEENVRAERIPTEAYVKALLSISDPDKVNLKLNVKDRTDKGYWNALVNYMQEQNPSTTINMKEIERRQAPLNVAKKNAFFAFQCQFGYYDVAKVKQYFLDNHKVTILFNDTVQWQGVSCIRGKDIVSAGYAVNFKNKKLWMQLNRVCRVAYYTDIPQLVKAGGKVGRQAATMDLDL